VGEVVVVMKDARMKLGARFECEEERVGKK